MTAETLMIQGTGSGVGKSVITAALCRRFYLDGLRVAPFKAQNMSLNSFVTDAGGEISRAQAFQAEACGLRPTVEMNPILLKPSGDKRSQVIVMGKVTGTRDARDYYAGHAAHKKIVRDAFASLCREYDLVVMEGAGSPAEINLKQFDLVNMAVAKQARSPVLIVGDIDRGGVFAWMKGTYDLLPPDEQSLVAGFIINKFRGDPDLLTPGIDQFENLVGKPVLGTIPYFKDLVVDEEDALPAWNYPAERNGPGALDAAVLWMPRMANFTDHSPLAYDPDVTLRYVHQPFQLGAPDLLVIPGSKNTLEDLRFLKEKGLANGVRRCQKEGSVILGICGGFQMLGGKISDPHHLESSLEKCEGLGFFDAEAIMEPVKITRQIRRKTTPSALLEGSIEVEGYEMHHGRTQYHSSYQALFDAESGDNAMDFGIANAEGDVIGTYLHGFLDADDFRNAFLDYVRDRRKIPIPEERFNYRLFREKQMDRLVKWVCGSLRMETIRDMAAPRIGTT